MSPLIESRVASPSEEREINWHVGKLKEPSTSPAFPLAEEVLKSIQEGRIHRLLYQGDDYFEANNELSSIKNYLLNYRGIRIQSRIIRDRSHSKPYTSVLFIKEKLERP